MAQKSASVAPSISESESESATLFNDSESFLTTGDSSGGRQLYDPHGKRSQNHGDLELQKMQTIHELDDSETQTLTPPPKRRLFHVGKKSKIHLLVFTLTVITFIVLSFGTIAIGAAIAYATHIIQLDIPDASLPVGENYYTSVDSVQPAGAVGGAILSIPIAIYFTYRTFNPRRPAHEVIPSRWKISMFCLMAFVSLDVLAIAVACIGVAVLRAAGYRGANLIDTRGALISGAIGGALPGFLGVTSTFSHFRYVLSVHYVCKTC